MTNAQRDISLKWAEIPTDYLAIKQGYYFDEDDANRVVDFFPTFLRHTKSEWRGTPFNLEEWQKKDISRAFGWKRPNGYRRFKEIYWETGKKNGKSTLMAGLSIEGLFEEPGAEVYVGAVNRYQTKNVYEQAEMMILASQPLRKHCRVVPSAKRITFPKMGSSLEAMSADAESKDGQNMSRGILDEIHRFKNSRLYDVLKYAGVARRQAMLWNITTAGSTRHSLWGQLRKRAERVLKGIDKDLHFLPVVYAADKDKDDLEDPATWKKANPSLGTILSIDEFREEMEVARQLPGEWAKFLRLRLGIPTDDQVLFIDMNRWFPLEIAFPWSFFKGIYCFAAIDLSSNKDLAACTVSVQVGEKIYTKTQFFMAEGTLLEREEADQVPYSLWRDQGWITQTEGSANDPNAIRKFIHSLSEAGVGFYQIGVDPWNALSLSNDLKADGYDVVDIRQTMPVLTSPTKSLERRILRSELTHDGNPVQDWCVSNLVVTMDDSGNIRPSKAKSSQRIDGAVTLIMTIGLVEMNPDVGPPTISVIRR